jgi:hypothetical protein
MYDRIEVKHIGGCNSTVAMHRPAAGSCNHLYATCILLLAVIFIAGCAREVVVPQPLTGEWKTSAPGYADRYIKFTDDTLAYGIGNGEEISHRIKKIESEKLGRRTAYIFYYIDAEGDKAFLSFIYKPDTGGTIQIKNDDKIWEKAAP